MKRTALLGALLVAVVACSMAISTPQPANARLLMCCEGYYQTSQWWAKAPTCGEAQAAFRDLAWPEADSICGGSACGLAIPPCENWAYEDPANPWKIDGRASFGCLTECGPILP